MSRDVLQEDSLITPRRGILARMTPDTEPDPREARLPVWARDLLNDLRTEVAGLNDELATAQKAAEAARLRTSPEDSLITVDGPDGEPIGLPGTTVRYCFPEGRDLSIERVDEESAAVVVDVTGPFTIRLLDRSRFEVWLS
jgi:hypothetical protein